MIVNIADRSCIFWDRGWDPTNKTLNNFLNRYHIRGITFQKVPCKVQNMFFFSRSWVPIYPEIYPFSDFSFRKVPRKNGFSGSTVTFYGALFLDSPPDLIINIKFWIFSFQYYLFPDKTIFLLEETSCTFCHKNVIRSMKAVFRS